MTPCEKIGLKVGDEVKLLAKGAKHTQMDIGEIFILDEDDGTHIPFFLKKNRENLARDRRYCLRIPSSNEEEKWVEMVQTEAEKRGAKFGTMGVEKATGKRCVWIAESLVLPGYWEIDMEGKAERAHRRPEEIRLDHEPEFKEVPFCVATHDQRMVVENVRDEFGQEVSDIFWSKKRELYVILLRTGEADTAPSSSVSYTVRIPS